VRYAGKQRVVAVVDDDVAVLEAVENLLRSADFRVECFTSAEAFLGSPCLRWVTCLVLDIELPGMNGLQLQQRLLSSGSQIPVVFFTARDDADGRMRTRALDAGAFAFLCKPFIGQELLSAVHAATVR
jgi:FixJ family two-component response regulator